MEDEWSTSGLMLAGVTGNGKSLVIKTLKAIIAHSGKKDPVAYDYCGQQADAFLRVVKAYELNEMFMNEPSTFKCLKSVGLLAIDDLGTEALEIQSYGNLFSPITDLLYARYDNRLFTIISTNLTPKKIRDRYGDRIADRFKETMTQVVFPNMSFRGKTDAKGG